MWNDLKSCYCSEVHFSHHGGLVDMFHGHGEASQKYEYKKCQKLLRKGREGKINSMNRIITTIQK